MSDAEESPSRSAELILHNAAVVTMAGSDGGISASRPTSLAIGDGKILALGDEQTRAIQGPRTRTLNLDGRTVIPGINDAHLHFTASSMVEFGHTNVGADVASTWAEVVDILERTSAGSDGWIRAHGWDEVTLGAGGARLVAQCRPSHPVLVFDKTGHQLLANRTALEIAGVDENTSAPGGGVVERHESAIPTGLLKDAAMALVVRHLPAVPRTVLRSALLKMQSKLHAWGLTSLTEPGLGPGSAGLLDGSCTSDALNVLGDLALDGELTMRMSVLMLFAGTGGVSAAAVRTGLQSHLASAYSDRGIDAQRLRIAGVKVFADGIPRSNTAWMSEPYGEECTHGSLVVVGGDDTERAAELAEILRLIHEAGLQAGVHATGDAATETAIAAFIAAQESGHATDNRHYIIHGAFSSNSTLGRLAGHDIGYSTNPLIRAGGGAMVRAILGEDRFARHQPLNSALKAGVKLNIASDAPVATPDWRRSVVAAVTRATVDRPAAPGDPERISGLQALSAMTVLPAWQDHAESYKGTLHPGMVADLCVLDGVWPADEHIEDLLNVNVALTMVGGDTVHTVPGL